MALIHLDEESLKTIDVAYWTSAIEVGDPSKVTLKVWISST